MEDRGKVVFCHEQHITTEKYNDTISTESFESALVISRMMVTP